MITENKNSKKVYLRRAARSVVESTAVTAQGAKENPELKAYFDNAYRAVGSYWQRGSMRPGTGLSLQEENLLLPYVLNIPQEDRDFRQKATDFFHEISTKIEPTNQMGEGGTELEIGLTEDNNESVGKDNLPLNIMDYIRYRHAIKHPECALSEADAKGNRLKTFYIFDPVTELGNNVTNTDFKDRAMAAYLEVKAKPAEVKQYLILLNIDPALHKGSESVKLRSEAETNPTDFLKVHEDKNKNTKYFIKRLIIAKVLRESGTRILITENDFQIGGNLDEAISYMKDPINSQQVVIFKGMLQDAAKKANPEAVED